MTPNDRDTQPLDALMARLKVSNADLVRHSTEQLSFKQIQKGRKGRRLTPHIQKKILTALHAAHPGVQFTLDQLFDYE